MPVWTEKDTMQDDKTNTDVSGDTLIDDIHMDDSCTPSADGFLIADTLEHEAGIPEKVKSRASESDPLVQLVWETLVGST